MFDLQLGEIMAFIQGNLFNNNLIGTESNDHIVGYQGNDQLVGLGGNDTLNGANTPNIFGGNGGVDSLFGGAGADTFVASFEDYTNWIGGGGYAIIEDFNYWEGDKIDLDLSYLDYDYGIGNWSGTGALDTGIYYNNDLVAVVADQTSSNGGFIASLDVI